MARLRGRWLLVLAVLAGGLFMAPGAWAQEDAVLGDDALQTAYQAALDEYLAAQNDGIDDEADQYQAEVGEDGSITVTQPDGADFGLAFEVTENDDEEITSVDGVALVDTDRFTIDNLWVLIAGCLVFLMHLGFAMVESGLTRAKNTVNILFKNSMIICIGFLAYGLLGFFLHYPGFAEESAGWFAFGGWGFLMSDSSSLNDIGTNTAGAYGLDMTTYTDFFFQAMFCATGATIVSGAVCGRIKLLPFLLFTAFFTGIIYCLVGSWHWGGGYLNKMDTPFYDFAGSTVVHSVGGWGALMGAIILGPRLGKYAADGTVQPIPGHSMPLVTVGVFLLWFGWFGFNGGSVLNADAGYVSLVLCTTTFAAAAGGLATGITSWVIGGKPDLSMALNGMLAGLVGITAGADQMAMWEAVLIGAVAGVLVYFSVITFDKLKIDDPVGAVSVHLVCGIWGTLVVGILGDSAGGDQLISQIKGVVIVGIATAVLAAAGFLVLKFTLGLRVSEEEEVEGLDLGEHDMSAYPDFQQTYIKSYHAREI